MSADSATPDKGPDLAAGVPASTLADGGMLAGHVGDEAVLLVRRGGSFFAIGAECTHYHAPLADGLVVGDTVAQAYRRLYKLERCCRAQVLAMSTGQPLALLDDEMVKKVEAPNPRNSHSQAEREELYFAAMMRVLDRVMPGYAD